MGINWYLQAQYYTAVVNVISISFFVGFWSRSLVDRVLWLEDCNKEISK